MMNKSVNNLEHFVNICADKTSTNYNTILEIGSGGCPVAQKIFKKDKITRIDTRKFPNTIVGNYLFYNFNKKFDLIIDAHVLHTFASKIIVIKYLRKIFNELSPGGNFYLETMISHEQLSFNNDQQLFFDSQNSVLYKNKLPSRIILDAFEIETILVKIGFEIVYLCCPVGLKMIPLDQRDTAYLEDPDVIHIICQKAK